jgi:hypothetical protein
VHPRASLAAPEPTERSASLLGSPHDSATPAASAPAAASEGPAFAPPPHAQWEPRPRRDSEGSDSGSVLSSVSQTSRLSLRRSAFHSAGVGPRAAAAAAASSLRRGSASAGGAGAATPARLAAAAHSPAPAKAPSTAPRPLPVLQEVLDTVDIDD